MGRIGANVRAITKAQRGCAVRLSDKAQRFIDKVSGGLGAGHMPQQAKQLAGPGKPGRGRGKSGVKFHGCVFDRIVEKQIDRALIGSA
jgi:hypothetical protein